MSHIKGQQTEGVEATVQRENYKEVTITEMWWGGSHNQSADINSS